MDMRDWLNQDKIIDALIVVTGIVLLGITIAHYLMR